MSSSEVNYCCEWCKPLAVPPVGPSQFFLVPSHGQDAVQGMASFLSVSRPCRAVVANLLGPAIVEQLPVLLHQLAFRTGCQRNLESGLT